MPHLLLSSQADSAYPQAYTYGSKAALMKLASFTDPLINNTFAAVMANAQINPSLCNEFE